MSQDLQNHSIGIAMNKKCGQPSQNFRHFFCDLRGKPMPIEFIKGLKANQAPNYQDANMVVSPEQSHQPLTKVKTHTGCRKFLAVVRRSIFMSAGQEIGTQSRTGFGLGRQGQVQYFNSFFESVQPEKRRWLNRIKSARNQGNGIFDFTFTENCDFTRFEIQFVACLL